MRLTDGTARARLTLALDVVALMAFVLAGMRSHATGTHVQIFLRNAVPIAAAWLGAALGLRTYRPPSTRRLLATWLVAVPIGVAVRSIWVGSPTGERFVVFLAVAMAFTLLFLAGSWLIASLAGRRLGEGSAA